MNIVFNEKQRFAQWWLWVLLLGIASIFVCGIYTQLIMGITFGDKPMSDSGLLVVSIAYFVFVYCFLSLSLKTTINNEGIKYQYFPFVNEQLKWSEIKKVELLNYGFVGWGIRYKPQYGTIYNVSGNKGLAIELNNGKKVLIGTQKEEELNFLLNSELLKQTLLK